MAIGYFEAISDGWISASYSDQGRANQRGIEVDDNCIQNQVEQEKLCVEIQAKILS